MSRKRCYFICLLTGLIFFVVIILPYLTPSVCAKVETEPGRKGESAKILKYTDYNALKGTELIRMVQLVLEDAGFDPGPIDGVLGPKTREAIKEFQIKNTFEPTGELDRQTMDRLFWAF